MLNKPTRIYHQSAVVPYLWYDDRLHIVLITSTNSGKWGIPKGIIEPHLSPAESAAKEALEEAGAIGQLSHTLICEYSYEKWGGTCQVQVYPLLVTDLLSTWDESEFRERTTVPMQTAVDMVKPVLVSVLATFRGYINGLQS
ncbi:MAG: NUDIX hydrolase [Leptolyngbya sp. SIO1D8]|nr:NUDIX hydrolase [Leptolyngbya sp. SIO1D8]